LTDGVKYYLAFFFGLPRFRLRCSSGLPSADFSADPAPAFTAFLIPVTKGFTAHNKICTLALDAEFNCFRFLSKIWRHYVMAKSFLLWLHGLTAAFIGAAANSITVTIVDPIAFNFGSQWRKTGLVAAVSGVLAAVAYLKKSPVPETQTERKTGE
jgi:hypothetical protein